MGFANEAAGGAAAADDFGFDTSGIDPNELGRGGVVAKPGIYAVEVEDVARNLDTHDEKDGKPKAPHLSYTFLVLTDRPNQDGKGSRIYHRVMLKGKGGTALNEFVRDRTAAFLLTSGIARSEGGKLVDAKSGKGNIAVESFESIKGKRYVVEMEYDQKVDPSGALKANGKPKYVVDRERVRIKNDRLYSWDDPNYADVTGAVSGGGGEVDADL